MSSRSSLMRLLTKACLVGLVVSAALLAVAARPAAAATPCWKTLLNDWYDGRIDNTYPLHCYHDALKHLPSDVQTYSSAHDDIERALQSAIALDKKKHKGAKIGPNTLLTPAPGGKKNPTAGGSGTGGGGTTSTPGRKPGGGLAGGAASSSPSSVPVPLLVLGGLALLLVAAGAAGLIAKRVQSRRQPPNPGT